MTTIRWMALLLLAVASISYAGDFCGYINSNQLIQDKGFRKNIETFFGKRKGSYFSANGRIAEQAIDGIWGPPDNLKSFGENLVLASGCRAHSCTEKTAVVMSCPSEILAIGLIHFDCFEKNHPPSCSENSVLTIFFSDANKNHIGSSELERWGKNAAAHDNKSITYEYRSQSNTALKADTPKASHP